MERVVIERKPKQGMSCVAGEELKDYPQTIDIGHNTGEGD
jgi:hypothetical protein